MGRKAAHKRNAAAAAAAGGAEKSGPAKKAEDGQEKQKGSTKAERGSKQKERRQQRANNEWGAWEQLTDLGLRIRSMGSDGNCLFRSVGDQMAGDQGLHKELRKKTMDYVEAHEEDFAPFVEDDVKFADYVKMMRKDGMWAGNIELQALSMALKRNICIHRFMSPVWLIKNFDDPTVPIIHLSYHGNEHYNSVRRIDDNGSGPPSEIGIGENHPFVRGLSVRKDMQAPAGGGGPTRSGPKGGKGAKAGKGEDTADVQAVMRGTGCTDLERAAEVLKEFRGDVDSAIEFLVADMASSAADEEQAGAVDAQDPDSCRESGPSASTSAGNIAENGEGCSGEEERNTSPVEVPGSAGGGRVELEGKARASLYGRDAGAKARGLELDEGLTSADDVSRAPAPAGEGADLSVPVASSGEASQTTPGAHTDVARSKGGASTSSVEREQGQVAPPHENGAQTAFQGHGPAEESTEEGAEEGEEAAVVKKAAAEGCARGVESAEGGQSEKGSGQTSDKLGAVCTNGGGEDAEDAESEGGAADDAPSSPVPSLALPGSPGASKGDEAEPSQEPSSWGAGARKGATRKGERERVLPRKQHPNKQRNGKAPGRNQQCPCGSRKKYKSCCGTRSASSATSQRVEESRHEEERRTAPAALQALYI